MKKPSWIDEFVTFIARGNVMNLAVGVVVGGAFTAIVTAIVENLLTPIIGLAVGNTDFSKLVVAGFGIGNVINAVITFLITAFVVFWIVKPVNKLMEMTKKEEEPEEEAPAAPTQDQLMAEMIDLLRAEKGMEPKYQAMYEKKD